MIPTSAVRCGVSSISGGWAASPERDDVAFHKKDLLFKISYQSTCIQSQGHKYQLPTIFKNHEHSPGSKHDLQGLQKGRPCIRRMAGLNKPLFSVDEVLISNRCYLGQTTLEQLLVLASTGSVLTVNMATSMVWCNKAGVTRPNR